MPGRAVAFRARGRVSRTYLDWNATAPIRPEARDAMIGAMDLMGNPSSVHAEGRAAKALLERCRAEILEAAGAQGYDLIFTSGATEAAATALSGGWSRIIASEVEHDCIAAHAPLMGERWQAAGVGRDGIVPPSGVLARDPGRGDLVAVQLANSETGVRQDVPGMLAELRQSGAVMLADAVQSFGKLPFAASWQPPAIYMLSAHKIGGPKGIGALLVPQGMDLAPLIVGGGQEMSRRAGTENLAGIAGFAAAASAAQRDLERGEWDRVAELRKILENLLEAGDRPTISVGKDTPRLPNTLCLIAPGWKGETQVMRMDLEGFAISAGSACSSGKVRSSRVLRAMGYGDGEADCAVRISLGPATTEVEVRAFAEAWRSARDKAARRRAA